MIWRLNCGRSGNLVRMAILFGGVAFKNQVVGLPLVQQRQRFWVASSGTDVKASPY